MCMYDPVRRMPIKSHLLPNPASFVARTMYAPDVTRLRDAMNRKQHLTLADLKADPGFWLTQSKVKPQPYAATVEALRRIPQSVSPHDALLAAGMTSPALASHLLVW